MRIKFINANNKLYSVVKEVITYDNKIPELWKTRKKEYTVIQQRNVFFLCFEVNDTEFSIIDISKNKLERIALPKKKNKKRKQKKMLKKKK